MFKAGRLLCVFTFPGGWGGSTLPAHLAELEDGGLLFPIMLSNTLPVVLLQPPVFSKGGHRLLLTPPPTPQ